MEGRKSSKNTLNDLTGKQWITFTRSWFIHNPPPRSPKQITHPAKFPEGMIREFIEFFTKKGELVLDPFMGVGSTLIAASLAGRKSAGFELNSTYYSIAMDHAPEKSILVNGDARTIAQIWKKRSLPPADFAITSPPYWDMLAHSRGNVFSTQKRRKAQGLDTVYSRDDSNDLGNIGDYQQFLDELTMIFKGVRKVLAHGRYLVIILQNLRSPQGKMIPLAWDLTARLEDLFTFKGERIWCQDNKRLGIWGYPREFVTNVHHHYCLIFKKEKR
ncbi:MAG: site-specific DNA-methyltransferase [Candidatus Eremiobacteraeota bacterium]|nr:site-specific DNA-methyltransferase [Candidatus Eremiobacteraeota bacterium]